MKKILIISMICTMFISQLWPVTSGKVMNITGDKKLFMKKNREEKGIPLKIGMSVELNYFIQSGKNTEAEILLTYEEMNTTVKIRKNSLIKIVSRINKKKKKGVFLVFGRLWSLFKGKKKSGYAVETFNAVAGVEGTEFEVAYNENLKQTILKVNSGKVRFSGKKGVLPGLPPQVKHLVKDQIGIAEKIKVLRILKKEESKEYNRIEKEMESLDENEILTVDNNYEEESELVLQSSEIRNELECDGDMTLVLKFLKKENFHEKNFVPLDCVAKVWINDCNYYNGKELIYKAGQHIKISNLSRNDLYEVTVLCGGIQHSFEIDLSSVRTKLHIHKVKFAVKQFGFQDKETKENFWGSKIKNKFKININSQKMKFAYVLPSDHPDPSDYCIGFTTQKCCTYFPFEVNNFEISVSSDVYEERIIQIDLSEPEEGQFDWSDKFGFWIYELEKKQVKK
ncbi:FecR domain-containing protein [bacterium]|nr:FecR domain-containing protein [bacterium]